MEEVTKVLPAIALRGTTILPDMIVHFDISRAKSIRAVEEAMLGDQKIFLITQKDPDTEVPGLLDVYKRQVKQYKKLFELDGVQLDFKEDALEAIAKKSLERKTGARGLRAIMEDTMMDLMYEIPSDNTTKECVITKDAVEKKAEPEIIHGEPAPVPRRNMGRRSGRPETA